MTSSETFWSGKLVLVTGGASFIGSTLTDHLLARGAKVRIVDDLTSGHLDNIKQHSATGKIDFTHADLREPGVTRSAVQGVDTVFHLAADHGGRGYVDLHQAGPASNFFLDGLVFAEALRAKVKKVVFASSGCVYPNFLQSDVKKELYLTEDLTDGPNDADNTYGWAKLMGEFTLRGLCKGTRHGGSVVPLLHCLRSARRRKSRRNRHDCPRFSWTGPLRSVGRRHADPQLDVHRRYCRRERFSPGEKINDGTAINLGTMERIKVIDAVKMVCDFTGHKAEIKLTAGHADRPAEPRRGQFPGEKTSRMGTESPVPRRFEAHHRMVLRHEEPRRSEAHLRTHAHREIDIGARKQEQRPLSTLEKLVSKSPIRCIPDYATKQSRLKRNIFRSIVLKLRGAAIFFLGAGSPTRQNSLEALAAASRPVPSNNSRGHACRSAGVSYSFIRIADAYRACACVSLARRHGRSSWTAQSPP